MAEVAGLAKNRRPSCLLITALDRLSRSLRDTLNVVEALREANVILYQRGFGPIATATFPEKAALAGMSLAGEAENYSRSVRAKMSWDRRRAEGKPTSNKHPYGLQLQGERDVPIKESAAWVRRAFEWYDSGMGMAGIAKRFAGGAPVHSWLTSKVGPDGERIRKTRTPTRWESLRISKLLKQKRYRGTIVSPELFDRVQGRIASKPKSGSRRKREYPLSGALRCEGCGRHLHGIASGGGAKTLADGRKSSFVREKMRYYGCLICEYRLNAKVVENGFFERIGELRADDAQLKRWILAEPLGTRDITERRAELRKLELDLSDHQSSKLIDRVFDLARAARLTESELRRQVERVKEELSKKQHRLSELRSALDKDDHAVRSYETARRLLSSFRRLYDAASYEAKRELVASLVDALGGATTSRDGMRWTRDLDTGVRSGGPTVLRSRARIHQSTQARSHRRVRTRR